MLRMVSESWAQAQDLGLAVVGRRVIKRWFTGGDFVCAPMKNTCASSSYSFSFSAAIWSALATSVRSVCRCALGCLSLSHVCSFSGPRFSLASLSTCLEIRRLLSSNWAEECVCVCLRDTIRPFSFPFLTVLSSATFPVKCKYWLFPAESDCLARLLVSFFYPSFNTCVCVCAW